MYMFVCGRVVDGAGGEVGRRLEGERWERKRGKVKMGEYVMELRHVSVR